MEFRIEKRTSADARDADFGDVFLDVSAEMMDDGDALVWLDDEAGVVTVYSDVPGGKFGVDSSQGNCNIMFPWELRERRDVVQGDKLREWKRENMYRLSIDLNRNSEDDKPIIVKLEEQENKAQYVKGLIRQDIDGGSSEK